MGRRHQSHGSRAAAGQPGAHTNGPNCRKSRKSRQLAPLASEAFTWSNQNVMPCANGLDRKDIEQRDSLKHHCFSLDEIGSDPAGCARWFAASASAFLFNKF